MANRPYSIDEIDVYLRCPFRYNLLYVQKVRLPQSVWQIEGDCHVKSMVSAVSEKLTPKAHLELFCQMMESRTGEVGLWLGRTFQQIVSGAMRVVTQYHAIWAKYLKDDVIRTNVPVEVQIGDVPVTGTCDLYGQHTWTVPIPLLIPPHKWGVASCIKLGWMILHTKDSYLTRLMPICPMASRSIVLSPSTRKRYSKRMALTTIPLAVSSIEAGAFHKCHPQDALCAPATCEFWERCAREPAFRLTATKGKIPREEARGLAYGDTPSRRPTAPFARRRERTGSGAKSRAVSKTLAPVVSGILSAGSTEPAGPADATGDTGPGGGSRAGTPG